MDELLETLKNQIVEPSIKEGRIYLNVKKIYNYQGIMHDLADRLREGFDNDVNCVLGYCGGGIPLAREIKSRHPELELAFIEKIELNGKPYRVINGYQPDSYDKIAIVDDVCVRGSNIKRTKDLLRNTGAEISGFHFIVNYGFRKNNDENIKSLFVYDDFV